MRRGSIHGPYKHGRKWRLVVRREGKSVVTSFDTSEEAERAKGDALRAASSRSVSDAIDEFVDDQKARGLRAESWPTTRRRLRALLGVLDSSSGGLIIALTPARAERLFKEYRARPTRFGRPPSVDTYRNALAEAGTFGRWCIEQGWLKANPFEAIKAKGKRKRGQPQLRVTESRALVAACLALAGQGDHAATAVAATFLLGVRASELTGRQIRDLDDGARLLWIPSTKTEAGRRQIEVPEILREPLLATAKGRKPTESLFRNETGGPANRHWLHYHTERIRKAAKLPKVTPHGLRGTHYTIARAAGATGSLVAAALGHAGTAVGDNHYADQASLAAVTRDQVLRVVRGGKS